MRLQAYVFCGCFEHGRVKRPPPELAIADVYTYGDVTIATGRLTWNEGIGCILWDGRILPKVSRKSWAALHAWARHPPRP